MDGGRVRVYLSIDGERSMKNEKLHDAIEAQGGRTYVAAVIDRTPGHISHCENGRYEWKRTERYIIETGQIERLDIWWKEKMLGGATDD